MNLAQLGAGIKAGWEFSDLNSGILKPELPLGYRYALVNDADPDTVNFHGGGSSFQAQGPTPPRSVLDLGGSSPCKPKATGPSAPTITLSCNLTTSLMKLHSGRLINSKGNGREPVQKQKIYKKIGPLIKAHRNKSGISQQALAKMIGFAVIRFVELNLAGRSSACISFLRLPRV